MATADEIRFSRDIRPILSDKCFACHGPDESQRQADLRLDTPEGATADLGGYAAVVPGDPDNSSLIARIRSTDPDQVMPPATHPKRLSDREKKLLETWIRAGAKYEQHWAFVRPKKATLPTVNNAAWPRNAIDSFVLARLEREALVLSPEADPATLCRRLHLDLAGLPPGAEAVKAFVASFSPSPTRPLSYSQPEREKAYEALVDRLLASPEFGERWARPWLDVARYADSHGFQRDDLREIWAYRDWVIDALNADMPFDQFTLEQVAGDLLPDATLAQRIATGFHRCTPTNVEAGTEPEESRINQVLDRVNTTGAVWLGLTLECAQCHTHKFDPITQRDYYRLLAFFNNTEAEADRSNPKTPGSIRFLGPSMTIDENANAAERRRVQRELAELDTKIKAAEKAAEERFAEWDERTTQEVADQSAKPDKSLTPRLITILRIDPEKRNAKQKKELRKFFVDQEPEVARLRKEIAKAQKKLEALKPPATLVMKELAEPRATAMFNRGVYTDPGDAVTPGVPAVLHALPEGPSNRITLARWLTSRDNPLSARVTVNRWWAEIFGRGIVATVEDFGVQGEPPTHPELLDWLAVEFMDQGWSMKKLLKTIVMSSTYRQASHVTPALMARDDQNRLLARGPRFRMDAEMIRDNALTVSGLLSLKKGGPPIYPPQPEGLWDKVGGQKYDYIVSPPGERHRRGIYVVLKRCAPYPSFVTFDASARMACVVKRSRSNTPLQALALLNDPVYVEAAMALAKRVLVEQPDAELDDRIAYAMQLCLARKPAEHELSLLRALYEQQRAAAQEDAKATKRFVGSISLPAKTSPAQFAGWYAVATALLNLDEAITKN
jgi:hypothetical protein